MDDTNTSLYLPIEVIGIILSKLSSVKSLLRFKSVCRSWNILISDPIFVKNHHQRSKELNSEDLFLRKNSEFNSEGFSLVKLDDQELQTIRVVEAPYRWEEVLCFCDGLLLVHHIGSHRCIALWNPSTGEERRLSLPANSCYDDSYYGLCHDPITDDVKVVVLDRDNYYTVYSFKNNSWKRRMIGYESNYDGVPYYTRGVCVDGAIYWAWRTWSYRRQRIIYFDPRDDKLKILQKPENASDSEQIRLVNLGGSLCLYCKDIDEETTVRIWTKEKGIDNNSWKTLMNVENVGVSIRWFEPQCFIGNKIVIRYTLDNRLVVYNPIEKRFELFDEDTKVFGRGLVPYVDSMFFPSTTGIYKYISGLISCLCV